MGAMKFRVMRSIIRLWVALIARVDVHGMHELPEGNVFVVANHLGRLDTAVFFCVIDREDIIMPIAGKYRNHPLYGLMGWAVNGIWLSRDGSDAAALRQTLTRMKQGGLLVMAPEGTRSPTEAMQEARLGAAFLADKSGYPIVPVGVTGTEDRLVKEAFREWSKSCVCPPELPVCRCRGRALGETLTRKPVTPSEEEARRNPRSRSARLRAWRKAA